ncbi:MAG: PRC-barrel protein [Solidesulfovibrio magneticus str. Maddingley MBC34]|uniref:PRC-barrel protein n=1 Tax=Solidesulfovibrio magneticus str. Maddingley MBC34 TaxID=1206767 RepID=K6FGW7_9BACT|nr:MAG: PRC-barrel protein [Solidesulfovibrio magneticus str. Maddingley MBC34]
MSVASKTFIIALTLSLILTAASALAQAPPVVGTIGITSEEVKTLAKGWSIKKDILNKDVYNDANEKVGVVEDIVVTPDKALSYAIVGTGGFLGMAKHDVVIPINQLKMKSGRINLPGATKESVKAMPEFKYAD